MSRDMFSFNQMMQLAQTDPEAFDTERKRAIEELIDSAPENYQRRLLGLQFQIDAARQKAKNPMEACINISNMMHDAVADLQGKMDTLGKMSEVMENNEEFIEAAPQPRPKTYSKAANIIPFPSKVEPA